jgi:hypothetical protein
MEFFRTKMSVGYDLDCRWCDSKSNSEEVEFRGNDWHCSSCVKSCQILSSEINERDDDTGEYCVEVNVLIAVASGGRDDEPYEDAYENITPDLHIIYVHFECDEEGDFCVVDTEE